MAEQSEAEVRRVVIAVVRTDHGTFDAANLKKGNVKNNERHLEQVSLTQRVFDTKNLKKTNSLSLDESLSCFNI